MDDAALVINRLDQARSAVGTVAVIDGGISPAAAERAGIRVVRRVRLAGRPDGASGEHGALVARALGEACPGCRVIDIGVLRGRQGRPETAPRLLARGLDVAAAAGARTIVVAMGSAGACDAAVRRAVVRAQRRAVIVAAAGNDPAARTLPCPAQVPGVISVGGLGSDGQPGAYSARRTRPAVWAYGGIESLEGTSFAAPRVAGGVASLTGTPAVRAARLRAASAPITGRAVLDAAALHSARVGTWRATPAGLVADVRAGEAIALCIPADAPDPRWGDGATITPLSPGAYDIAAAPVRRIIRVTGAPGARIAPNSPACSAAVTS